MSPRTLLVSSAKSCPSSDTSNSRRVAESLTAPQPAPPVTSRRSGLRFGWFVVGCPTCREPKSPVDVFHCTNWAFAPSVSFRGGCKPPTATAHTSFCVSAGAMNAIQAPSWDQLGKDSEPPAVGNGWGSPTGRPSWTRATQTWKTPARSEINASRLASGDHAGLMSTAAVREVGGCPSVGGTIHTSRWPPATRWKAIQRPSGENFGQAHEPACSVSRMARRRACCSQAEAATGRTSLRRSR